MIRKLLLIFIFFIPSLATAQTTVNLSVTDAPDGQSWNNGTWSVVISTIPGGSPPAGAYRVNSGGGSVSPQSGVMSATGTASLSLPANSNITPAQSIWNFQVCPQGTPGPSCFSQGVIVTTSSPQTVSLTPPSIRVDMHAATPPFSGYADGEFTGVILGATYYNLTSQLTRICQTVVGNLCTLWANVGGSGGGIPGGVPIQTQVNNGGVFGGTPCENFGSITVGPENVDCDWHSKGPNPWFDITRYNARALTGPIQNMPSTTATCTSGLSTVTLASAIDFINGDGIVLKQCGPATTLSTPAVPTAAIPKGILNGVTTRSYKIIAEDYGNGITAASPAITITNAPATLGLNTINVTGVSIVNNVYTVTTAATHNIEVGERVHLDGMAGAGGSVNFFNNTNWFVQTTPAGNTFTVGLAPQGSAADELSNGSLTGGTVLVPAHVWLRWTGQNNVMCWFIYRQDGGAGPYNLVGLAQGMDTFFDDSGYPVDIPSYGIPPGTAPAAALNQGLATTIVSGAGTTSLVLANAASNSISGAVTVHDNTVAFIAAYNAAGNESGGTVLVPLPNPAGASFPINQPLVLPSEPNAVKVELKGRLQTFEPIIPNNNSEWVGTSTNGTGAPSFSQNTYAQITGFARPAVLIQGSNNIRFDHILFNTAAHQGYAVLTDAAPSGGGGATNIRFKSCYFGTLFPGASALVLRSGGFQVYVDDSTLESGAAANDFYSSPSLRVSTNTAVTSQQSPGISYFRNLYFLNGGMLFDSDDVYPGISSFGGTMEMGSFFSEGTVQPLIWFRNINGSTGNYTFKDIQDADPVEINYTIDFSSPKIGTFAGMYFDRVGSSGQIGPVIINPSGVLQAVSLFLGDGSAFTNTGTRTSSFANGALPAGAAARNSMETDGAFRATNGAPLFAQATSLPVPVNLVVSAGGAIDVGTWTYAISAIDWNGGESKIVSFPISVSTTPGNQTITVTWNAPTPAPKAYSIWRCQVSGGLCATGFARHPSSPITGTTFVDTIHIGAPGGSPQKQSGGGPTGMSAGTGLWTPNALITNGAGASTVTSVATVARSAVLPDTSGTVILGPTNVLVSPTSPTIASGFNTSGFSIGANGTASFSIVVGTGAATNTGVLTMPAAVGSWNCWLTNQTRAALIIQTGSLTTSVTFTNYGTTFAATNWTNSDVLRGGCMAN